MSTDHLLPVLGVSQHPGTLSGGQSINDLFIDWLKSHFPYLQAWSDWDEVSDKFELVKKSFSGQDRLIKIAGRQITIPALVVLSYLLASLTNSLHKKRDTGVFLSSRG